MSVEPTPLAPSEAVLLSGYLFDSVKGRRVTLLDGRQKTSSVELAYALVKAALLAHERAGTIRLELRPELMVVPTGIQAEFPHPTIESRLLLDECRPVSDVVAEWLAVESADPWYRAVEQAKVAAVIRGLARARVEPRPRTFSLPHYGTVYWQERRIEASDKAEELEVWFEECRRTAIWQALERSIEEAFYSRLETDKLLFGGDPWDDESEEVQELREPRPSEAQSSLIRSILFNLIIWAFWSPAVLLPWGESFGCGTVLLGWALACAASTVLPIFFHRRFKRLGREGLWYLSYFMIPFILVLGSAAARVSLVLTALLVVVIAWTLRKAWTSDKLERSWAASDGDDPESARAEVHDAESPPPALQLTWPPRTLLADLPFTVQFLQRGDLPQPNSRYQTRMDIIRRRARGVRWLYGTAAGCLATAVTALYLLLRPWSHLLGDLPWIFHPLAAIALLVVTWAIVLRASMGSENVAGMSERLRRVSDRRLAGAPARAASSLTGAPSLTTLGGPILGAAWLTLTLAVGLLVALSLAPARWPFVVGAAAVSAAYVVVLGVGARALERRYPVHAPQRLLALRVFDSVGLRGFTELIDCWAWFGVLNLLDEPATAEVSIRSSLPFLKDRVEDTILKNEADLDRALREFETSPDSELRYPVNSLLCSGTIWQEAFENFLGKTDAVVMDLTGFGADDRGCSHELGRLVDTFPFGRTIILVNRRTDMIHLTELLSEAWRQISPKSPNASGNDALVVLDVGEWVDRQADISHHEWLRALRQRPDSAQVVSLLNEIASTARQEGESALLDHQPDWAHVLPKKARAIATLVLGLAFLSIIVVAAS